MKSEKPNFALLEHTADLGIMVTGKDPKDLFEKAAKSMMFLIVNYTSIESVGHINLSLQGPDLADLLVQWLGEIHYLLEGEKKIGINFTITTISLPKLDAVIEYMPFIPGVHDILTEIKAVTYHQIRVVKRKTKWAATIIFDV